jgi:plasmid stabilization system protein ParE
VTKHKVVLATAALQDITSTLEYVLARSGEEAAARVDELIDTAIRSLERLPDRGRVVPELERRGIATFREAIATPYRIVYRVMGREVWIVAVVDGRRDLDELLHERARR